MVRYPDFIIIGAMKSATSSLQKQLTLQDNIFMSNPKEPNYFSDDDIYARGITWYTSLFSDVHENCLIGEASTHYTKLPTYPKTVARLKNKIPDVKFIYIMRHPIDRLISHYIHEWTMGVYKCNLEQAINKYPELVAYGQYDYQLEPYRHEFGQASILPVFFDRLLSHPQEELVRICKHIGYQGVPQWVYDLEPSNVSSERIKRIPFYSPLVESEIATWLRRKLIPKGMRTFVKNRLVMKDRPLLDTDTKIALEDVFDKGLSRLGDWLGEDINCQNFKQVTGSRAYNWIPRDGV